MNEQHNDWDKSDKEQKRMQVAFYHKPSTTTPDYHLLAMLKRRKTEQGIIPKVTMLEATKAFWLPIACLDVETYSQKTLEQIFWESLAKLKAQENLLWNIVGKSLNLERPTTSMGSQAIFINNQPEEFNSDQWSDSEEINSGIEYDETGIL